jgi:uncharacterized protein YecT (DUF1311 family)
MGGVSPAPADGRAIESALDAARDYLLSRQREDGSFSDYCGVPVGASTAWVSGFVTAALAEFGGERALSPVARACQWLLAHRLAEGGWGYNEATGPDADSTAWALTALREAGLQAPSDAFDYLLSLRRVDGGFSTYRRDDGWGVSHPDVTPVAVLALEEPQRSWVAPAALDFAAGHADADGTWPAYWWRGRHYSTYWNRRLFAAYDRTVPRGPAHAPDGSKSIESAFDLAWVLALAVQEEDPPAALMALARMLIDRQDGSGRWPAGADLRITHPRCRPGCRLALGRLYTDEGGMITTSSALRALALSSDFLRRPRRSGLAAACVAAFLCAAAPAHEPAGSATADCENATSTSAMRACANRRYEAADRELQAVYKQLMESLDGPRKERLRRAQAAWRRYRDLQADFAADAQRGGTLEPLIRTTTQAALTEARTRELRSLIGQ